MRRGRIGIERYALRHCINFAQRVGEAVGITRDLRTARIRRELEDFPDSTPEGDKMYALEFGLPRLLLTARFVKWAEGHNR